MQFRSTRVRSLRRATFEHAAVGIAHGFRTVTAVEDISERKEGQLALAEMLASVTDVIGTVSEMRGSHTAGYQRRVTELAVGIARDMGMPTTVIADLEVAHA